MSYGLEVPCPAAPPCVVWPGNPAEFLSWFQLADTRISPDRAWFQRATLKDRVPGTTPFSEPSDCGLVKMAPTAGRRCNSATRAARRAASFPALKLTAPSVTTRSGVPSGIGLAKRATTAGSVNVAVWVEKP